MSKTDLLILNSKVLKETCDIVVTEPRCTCARRSLSRDETDPETDILKRMFAIR